MDDLSEEHLKWLVDSRSRNQQATLDLYLVIKNNGKHLANDVSLQDVAQELAAVAFSLWRAVFLSDITENTESRMIDVERFLATLVQHNAIAYQQDRNAREWTFQYYLNNAQQRLIAIAQLTDPNILDLSDVEGPADSAKSDWTIAHMALAKAVAAFDRVTSRNSDHTN